MCVRARVCASQEACRLLAYDGKKSLIRSFPSKVGVTMQLRFEPASRIRAGRGSQKTPKGANPCTPLLEPRPRSPPAPLTPFLLMLFEFPELFLRLRGETPPAPVEPPAAAEESVLAPIALVLLCLVVVWVILLSELCETATSKREIAVLRAEREAARTCGSAGKRD